MKVKSILLTIVGVAALGGGVAFAYFAGGGEKDETDPLPAPLVEVTRPEPLDRQPALVTTGILRANDPLAVTPEVSGRVETVHDAFEIGRRVPAGTPMIILDQAIFEAELMRAESALAGAKSLRTERQNDLGRQRELAESNFAAATTIEQLEANVARAEADVVSAEASVLMARKRLADTEISVPFDALVVASDVSPGSVIQPGQVLGRVVSADSAELTTAVTEADFRRFGSAEALIGTNLMFGPIDTGMQRQARIIAVSPALEDRARLVTLLARVEHPFEGDPPLVLNQMVDLEIPLPEASGNLFTLPNDALLPGQELWQVNDDSTLAPVTFTIERRSGGQLIVSSDTLTPDSRIVLTPLQILAEGVKVRLSKDGDT